MSVALAPINNSFTARPYQSRLIGDVVGAFRAGRKEVLLAACPNAGKTLMSLEIVSQMLSNGVKRVLVLAHGTDVLRTQYRDRLEEHRQDLVPFVDVRLPHERKKLTGKYDLVVVDEAHQFYKAEDGMVEKIIKAVKPKHVLLLTGSPSKFIADGFKAGENMFTFSLQELHDQEPGAVADVVIEVASASYAIKEEDYLSPWGEVRGNFSGYTQAKTNATLDDVLKTLRKRLALSGRKLDKFLNRQQLKLGNWNFILSKLRKTIVATPSIKVADQVEAYFGKNGVKCVVSHSEDGADDDTIETFKKDESVRLLIVVNRAQLGFDFSELFHFVDMTGSRNPDRIFQMLCRVVRCSKKDPKHSKLFVKVMSRAFPELHVRAFMSGVLSLVTKENFEKWNGKGFSLVEVPIKRPRRERKGEPGPRPEPKGPKVPVLEPGMLVFGDYFKALEHNPDDALAVYAMARLGEVVGLKVDNPAAHLAETLRYCQLHGHFPNETNDNGKGATYNSYAIRHPHDPRVKEINSFPSYRQFRLNQALEAAFLFSKDLGRRPSETSKDSQERTHAQAYKSALRANPANPTIVAMQKLPGLRRKRNEPVVDDLGTRFDSIKHAAIHYGVTRGAVEQNLLKKTKLCAGRTFHSVVAP